MIQKTRGYSTLEEIKHSLIHCIWSVLVYCVLSLSTLLYILIRMCTVECPHSEDLFSFSCVCVYCVLSLSTVYSDKNVYCRVSS